MAKKRDGLLDEMKVSLTAPFQIWENGVIYTERCSAVLDIGEGYLRFKLGKRPAPSGGAGWRSYPIRTIVCWRGGGRTD